MAETKPVVDGLNTLLADATVFYQKLRHYHWNVAGRHFFDLHAKFEELYTGWAGKIDDIAERILTIEGRPLHTLAAILKAASLNEDESMPGAQEMVAAVAADLETLGARAADVIELAEAEHDRGTVNLLDEIRDGIEKDRWMLRVWSQEAAKTWS